MDTKKFNEEWKKKVKANPNALKKIYEENDRMGMGKPPKKTTNKNKAK